MDIKDILLSFQKSKKLTGRKFADKIGVDSSQYNKWVTGANVPSIKNLEKIKTMYPDFDYSGNMVAEPGMEYVTKSKSLPVFDIYGPREKGRGYDIKKCRVIDYFAITLFSDAIGYVKMKDESMKGILNLGDYAALYDGSKGSVIFGEKYLIVFVNPTREPIIRFIRRGTGKDAWLFKANNPNFDDFELSHDKIEKIYLVRGGVLAG